MSRMEAVSISAAKAKLNEYVEQAMATHQRLMITKNGSGAAVLLSADDWESIEETLYWSSQPGVAEDIAAAEAEYAAGRTTPVSQLPRPA